MDRCYKYKIATRLVDYTRRVVLLVIVLLVIFHKINELIKEIACIMRTWGSFRVVLYAEYGAIPKANTRYGTIIEV